MRNHFDRELERLSEALIEMGSLIENAIEYAVQALIDKNPENAKKAIAYDNEVDQKERDIERLCLRLLLQQQPVASDLRTISSALKIITDMERIGDQASDISEITILSLKHVSPIDLPPHIPHMARATSKMVHDSVDAFVNHDLEAAKAVIAYDDIVDDLFIAVREELLEIIRTSPEGGRHAMDLFMVAKYFERIGDHAANVAEWVEFSITGQHKSHSIL